MYLYTTTILKSSTIATALLLVSGVISTPVLAVKGEVDQNTTSGKGTSLVRPMDIEGSSSQISNSSQRALTPNGNAAPVEAEERMNINGNAVLRDSSTHVQPMDTEVTSSQPPLTNQNKRKRSSPSDENVTPSETEERPAKLKKTKVGQDVQVGSVVAKSQPQLLSNGQLLDGHIATIITRYYECISGKKYQEAICLLTSTLRLKDKQGQQLLSGQNKSRILSYRAAAYFHTQKFDKVIRDFTETLEMKDEQNNLIGTGKFRALTLTARAAAYFLAQKYDKAIRDCTKALKMKDEQNNLIRTGKDRVVTLRNRAAAYFHTQKYHKAIQDRTEVLEMKDEQNNLIRTGKDRVVTLKNRAVAYSALAGKDMMEVQSLRH